jgi:hypothetical protein
MTDTTVDVSREGSTAILRIHGEITGGSEPPIMAAYADAFHILFMIALAAIPMTLLLRPPRA